MLPCDKSKYKRCIIKKQGKICSVYRKMASSDKKSLKIKKIWSDFLGIKERLADDKMVIRKKYDE